MNLIEIKIMALKKNLNMSELAKKLSINRRTMYLKIKKQDEEIISKIKKILS